MSNAYTRQRVTDLFARYDVNRDGFLTADEMARLGGQSAIDNTDRDKDGRISFDEAVLELGPNPSAGKPAARNNRNNRSSQPARNNQPNQSAPNQTAAAAARNRIISSFRTFDRNNDGFLSEGEISATLIQRADGNQDGKLTLNEVLLRAGHAPGDASNPILPQTRVVRVRLRNGRVVRAVQSTDADGRVTFRLL